jgi:hypothetical protein
MLLGQQMMLKASQKKMHSNYSSRRMWEIKISVRDQ